MLYAVRDNEEKIIKAITNCFPTICLNWILYRYDYEFAAFLRYHDEIIFTFHIKLQTNRSHIAGIIESIEHKLSQVQVIQLSTDCMSSQPVEP